MVYDIMTPYSGSNSLYGTVYVDEKIDDVLYPTGMTIDIEISTQKHESLIKNEFQIVGSFTMLRVQLSFL